ncbi:MAG: TonB-dependent receptor [Gammaproteobacteria bacterium]
MKNINLMCCAFLLVPFVLISQEVEEVIVTANKKAETLQEIPMNISVITESALEERGITNPEDYLRSIAGVSTPGGSNYYTFRGLNTSTSQRSSGTSSTYIDEVSGSLMGLFDVERIEVLRGPQGTLYGSNAIGGTIRYITNKPDSSSAYGKIRVGYGDKVKANDPETSIEMMYNLPLSDSLAVRAVYSQLVSPGIYKNIQTGNTVGEEDDSQLMITLGFNNGGKFKASLRYFNVSNKAYGILEPGQSKPGSADVYVADCPQASSWWYNWDGDPTCARLSAISNFAASEADYPNGDSVLTNYDPKFAHALAADESEDITREAFIANIKYDFGAFDANLIISDKTISEDATTDWARIDMDDYVPAPLIVDGDEYYQETTELRLISKPGKFEWTVGYYNYKFNEEPNSISQTQYAIDKYWLDYVTEIAAGLDPANYDATAYCPPFCDDHLGYPHLYYASYTAYNEQEETSLYGQFDYNVNEKLTLTIGIRDYEIKDKSKSYQYGIFYMDSTGCDGNDPAGTDCSELSGEESDTRMKYAVSYAVNKDLTLYTTRAAGYRPGGNQSPLPPFCSSDETAQETWGPRFNSDEAETTEFGIKSRGNNYTANVTYFEVDWDGIIINVTPGCGWSYNFNGGKAETSGWEVDFTYALSDELSLDFAGSSMTAQTSIDIASLGAAAGDRLPNTVETQWNLGLVYDTTILSYPSYARLDVNYYGDSFNTFAENPNSSSPDYTKLNFNLGLDLNESSKLQLSIDNLTDERTEAYIYAVEDTSWRPRNWMQWIPPRTMTLKYTYSF